MSSKPVVGSVSKLLVNMTEASQMLSLSQRSISFLVKDGRIPSVRIARRLLIRVSDLHAFIKIGSTERIRPAR